MFKKKTILNPYEKEIRAKLDEILQENLQKIEELEDCSDNTRMMLILLAKKSHWDLRSRFGVLDNDED